MARAPSRLVAVVAAVAAAVLGAGWAPPAGAAPPPPGYPIVGLDVSGFQGPIDWPAVARTGALFTYVRASEQADIADASFASHYHGARGQGLFAGAYHRARPDASTGRAQADFFVNQAQYARDGRTLPPMLDIEWPRATWPGLDACYNLTAAQMVAWIRDFVDRVMERTGQLAVIYTNPNWWGPCTANNTTFGGHPLFHSGYLPSPPPLPAGWSSFTFWQYDDEGVFPGNQDVFNGDYAALQRLAGGIPATVTLRAAVNSRYVTAENAGAAPLVANRTAAGSWERFHVVPAGGGLVALRSNVNGRYVTAENAGASPLVANRTEVGAWERFQVVANPDGTVSLLAGVNGRYVTAENAGASPLVANRGAVGLWERFTQEGPSTVVSLRAEVNGRYVAAENGGSSPLIANRGAVGQWERFQVVDAGSGYVGLRSLANNLFVTAENAGAAPLVANRASVGPWERFQLVAASGGGFALRANANGRFVAAESAGAGPLIANRGAVGLWERFQVGPA